MRWGFISRVARGAVVTAVTAVTVVGVMEIIDLEDGSDGGELKLLCSTSPRAGGWWTRWGVAEPPRSFSLAGGQATGQQPAGSQDVPRNPTQSPGNFWHRQDRQVSIWVFRTEHLTTLFLVKIGDLDMRDILEFAIIELDPTCTVQGEPGLDLQLLFGSWRRGLEGLGHQEP